MANWWDNAPLASRAPPQSGANWWEAAPMAPEAMGATQAVLRGVPKGFMLGLSDEASAAAAASPIPGADKAAQMGAPSFHPFDVAAGAARMATDALGLTSGEGQKTYDKQLAKERLLDKQAMVEQPAASIVGNIAGGILNPALAALPARGFLPGMAGGAAAGGLYGLGEGEGGADRLKRGVTGAGIGALIGGPLGALVGRQAAPQIANPIVEAGERLGVNVPKFVASESAPVQRLAAVERNIPFAGDRLVRSMDDLKSGMTGAADDLAAQMGATGAREAGDRASAEIQQYMGPKLSAISNRNYGEVDRLIAPNAAMTHPLSETQGVVANILARRQAAGISNPGAAVDAVAEAITKPGGLTYEGMKELRTRFGTRVSDDLTQDVIGKEFSAIYKGLTKDLRGSVQAAGGRPALAAFDKANAIHAMSMDRRASLEKIVGVSGDKTGEQVFDRITSMASSSSRGDLQTLLQAKKAMGPDAWSEMAGTLVQRIGRDAEGSWTPDRFITAWGKLSDNGKAALFGGSGSYRQSLEDIATISSRIKDRYAKFGNPSGTAQNVIGGSALTGGLGFAGISPITTVATLLGNRAVAGILASPATASSMSKWARAYEMLVTKPVAGAVATFQTASRNFANTIGDKLGLSVDPMNFLRAMQGTAPVRADENQQQ